MSLRCGERRCILVSDTNPFQSRRDSGSRRASVTRR